MSEFTLANIIKKRNDLKTEKQELIAATEARKRDIDQAILDLTNRESALVAGLDVERIERANKVIYVRGELTKPMHGRDADQVRKARVAAVEDAKRDLIEGAKKMRTEFMGVKNYDSFGDQRSDHPYGYGPRHGSVVFAVGLRPECRDIDLTAEQVEDALYYLTVLADYEKALKKTQAA